MNVAVLGGGVTGLTAAWRLSLAGHSVTVFEAAARLGGSVRTEMIDGWRVDCGPNSIQESPEVALLVDELGLRTERIEASPASRTRYLVHDGKLAALPSSPSLREFIATPILSFGSKWTALREIARKPAERASDVSVADFMRDHFGKEAVANVVQPFVSGIYAGDPERLSARHAFPRLWEAERVTGSLLRAAGASARRRKAGGLSPSPVLISFRKGMQTLTEALAAHLPAGSLELGVDVTAIAKDPGECWSVEWSGPQGLRRRPFDRVIASLPAASLARLQVGSDRRSPLSGLAAIEHPPVASVFVGLRRDQVRHPLDGFGALVPAAEQRSILGIIFSSSLFAGRAPEGHVALTVLAGGALQPEIARLPPADLAERVLRDLDGLLGVRGRPAFIRQTLWERAIPQYTLGYGAHQDAMAECERSNPGLFIGGNARDGISLPDCIRSGSALAQRVS